VVPYTEAQSHIGLPHVVIKWASVKSYELTATEGGSVLVPHRTDNQAPMPIAMTHAPATVRNQIHRYLEALDEKAAQAAAQHHLCRFCYHTFPVTEGKCANCGAAVKVLG
jgi:hypothetical protein